MNDVLRKFIGPDERELLSLVQYHIKQYERLKLRQGGLHPDDVVIMNMIREVPVLITKAAEQRKASHDEKFIPVNVVCPFCNVLKKRKPAGEQKNEKGYRFNKYHCDICKKGFTDYFPNNGKDQLNWYENFMDQLENKYKHFLNDPEIEKNHLSLKEQEEVFKKAYADEEAVEMALQKANEVYFKSIKEWRDYLLAAKIKNQWSGSSPMGES